MEVIETQPEIDYVKIGQRIRAARLETVSQNFGSKRDTVSQTTPFRKLHPGIGARTGMHFPDRAPWETASHLGGAL